MLARKFEDDLAALRHALAETQRQELSQEARARESQSECRRVDLLTSEHGALQKKLVACQGENAELLEGTRDHQEVRQSLFLSLARADTAETRGHKLEQELEATAASEKQLSGQSKAMSERLHRLEERLQISEVRATESEQLRENHLHQIALRDEHMRQLGAERDALRREVRELDRTRLPIPGQTIAAQLSEENAVLKAELSATKTTLASQCAKIEEERTAFWRELEAVRRDPRLAPQPGASFGPPSYSGSGLGSGRAASGELGPEDLLLSSSEGRPVRARFVSGLADRALGTPVRQRWPGTSPGSRGSATLSHRRDAQEAHPRAGRPSRA